MNEEKNVREKLIKKRFAGLLPVVVDIETTGVDMQIHGMLEIAAIIITLDDNEKWTPGEHEHFHMQAFAGAKIDPSALRVNKIKPDHPFRFAVDESEALQGLFKFVRAAVAQHNCQRAVLVGQNAHFDLNFMLAGVKRCQIKDNPFHAFTCFDTATLGALAHQQSVLARALKSAKISFDRDKAHSALYDAEKTAELFCQIVNRWDEKIG